MNQQANNLGDVFEFTRGEINAIINGLSEAPAKSTYALIKNLIDRSPVRTESVQATAADTGEAQADTSTEGQA